MTIDRIETYHRGPLAFVKVIDGDGAEGLGQIAPYNSDIAATVLHRQVAPLVIGEDPGRLAEINETVINENLKFPWSYVCRALGGVDTALWDMKGKREGKSVCELLGGIPRPYPVYGSSMRRDITPQDEASRLSALREESGFNAFKIRISSDTGRNSDEWPGRTEEVVRQVRHILGDQCSLLVDANSGYRPKKAIEVGRMLDDHGVRHYEEPCPYWELEWTAEVTSAGLKLDVTGGEQDCDLAQWARMIRMRAVDIVQPDICYVGGLSRALEVARLAESAGVPCIPHSANLSLVTVFSLHMMGALPNAGPYVEYSIEPTDWTDDLFSPALDVNGGCVEIPSGPGWGIEVNPDWFAGSHVLVSDRDGTHG